MSSKFPPIQRQTEDNVNPFTDTKLDTSDTNKYSKQKSFKKSAEVTSRNRRLEMLLGERYENDLNLKKNSSEDSNSFTQDNKVRERESVQELISKKKEMFLLQMSLDTKREEIRKLEEKAKVKEEALQKAEQVLEEDAIRFDAFLKENDKKAHDAIKKADEETRRRQEKVQELKKLTQQVQVMNSEIIKSKEVLDECLKCKKFLSDLTPPQWRPAVITDGTSDETPCYFQHPKQLMDIFAALEEQNLFLIQNLQETEQSLEELETSFRTTKTNLDSQTQALDRQIEALRAQIQRESKKADKLRGQPVTGAPLRIAPGDGESGEAQEKLLTELSQKVEEVYTQCGLDTSSRPSPLTMLAQLEARLEQLLQEVARLPPDFVAKAEREKDRRRREKKREEQQALLQRQQEERSRRAVERSLQAPRRRAGRPVMYRSKLQAMRKAKESDNDNGTATDELKHLS